MVHGFSPALALPEYPWRPRSPTRRSAANRSKTFIASWTPPSPTRRRRSGASIFSTSTASTSKPTQQFDDRSPIDTSIALGTFQKGKREHVKSAVAAARAAYPAWAALQWQERLAYVRRIADAIRDHRYELSALMGYEVGKNRLECVGDVEEAADLMAYYCDQIEQHNGFVEKMGIARARRRQRERAAAVWRVGRHLAVQFSARARGRAGRRRARGGQHRRLQAGERYPVARREAYGDGGRGRPAARACSTSSPAPARPSGRSSSTTTASTASSSPDRRKSG